jgi:hypothetical protein
LALGGHRRFDEPANAAWQHRGAEGEGRSSENLSAEPPMLQPAASNASIRANEFANFPTVIVFHTATVAADPIVIGGILAEGILLSVK